MDIKGSAKITGKLSSSFEDSLLLLVPRKATITKQDDRGVEYILDGQVRFISVDEDLKLTLQEEPRTKKRKLN